MILQQLKKNFTVALIWLFIISGAMGIISPFKDTFLLLTPFNLLVLNSFLLIAIKGFRKEVFVPFIIIAFFSWFIEVVGVQTHLIFGPYIYGSNLGFKVLDVPLLIGANWSLLVFATGMISNRLFNNKYLKAYFAAFLMVFLDFFMEQVAHDLDYWIFQNHSAPLINYVAWFAISLIGQLYFQSKFSTLKHNLGYHLYFAQLLFFIFLFYSI